MKKYNFAAIEKKWQKKWLKEKIYEPNLKNAKRPFYNLMMFPYPSAEGLHVGNMYAFVGSDIYGRYQRMRGNDVFEPIGLDGFGIHSENYALKIGAHPMEQAKISEKRFYGQLQSIGNSFAWSERLETYEPEYYKWTQWIFVQLWKHGLAYRKKQRVNWCPKDKTVLADEQVIAGKCERCGTQAIRIRKEQWFFRITEYAGHLLKNLEKLDWSEKVKIAQRSWIGESSGAEIEFEVIGITKTGYKLKVFTTRPDTLFGATFMVLSPDHEIFDIGEHEKVIINSGVPIKNVRDAINDFQDKREVSSFWRFISELRIRIKQVDLEENIMAEKDDRKVPGIMAINPATKKPIPIWVSDYVKGEYGTGAIMAVPAHDERDFAFAKKFNLPISQVICGNYPEPICPILEAAYVGGGHLVASGNFTGMDSEKAKWEITKFVGGEKKIQYRLRDWLISRQRYWGPPIPMIHCEACATNKKGEQEEMPGWYAVSEKDLPVELPRVKDFRPQGKGESPLASVKEFYEAKCPGCGDKARRETDVSDTFLDSAWYYLAYIMQGISNFQFPISNYKKAIKHWLPVQMYIGGAEHAVLHLLYVRFIAMVFHDLGLAEFDEPFKKFRAHGLLIKEGAKMSKSKGNVVNPDEYIKNFGADALRMYLMFLAPFEQGGDFRDAGILGTERFLNRVWKLFQATSDPEQLRNGVSKRQATGDKRQETGDNRREASGEKQAANNSNGAGATGIFNKTIKKVTEDIENLHYNTAVSALMILLNEFEKNGAAAEDKEAFIKLLAPFAPHMTEEIWREVLGNKTSVHLEQWPEYDEEFIKEESFVLVMQVNGKVRASIEVSADISENEAKDIALRNERVKGFFGGKKPRKIIYVPKKLVNIVT